MKGDWNTKKFLALFMAVAMVLASGIFVTTQSFKAVDTEEYEEEVTDDTESVELEDEASEEFVDVGEETGDEEIAEDGEEEEEAADFQAVRVQFDLNGGEGNDTPDDIETETDGELDSSVLPQLADYVDGDGAAHTFLGWSTDAGAAEGEDVISVDNAEMKLFAIWSVEEPQEAAEEEAAAEEAAAKEPQEEAVEQAAEEPQEEAVEQAAEEQQPEQAEEAVAEEQQPEETAEAVEEKAEEEVKQEETEDKASDAEAEKASDAETKQNVDEEGYLIDENGERILDENGNPIKADGTEETVEGEAASVEQEPLTEEQQLEQLLATYVSGYFSEATESGITVNVAYEDRVFPPGTTMKVTEIPNDEALKAVSGTVENAVEARGVDITFYNADGEEIQPYEGAGVSVSLALSQPLTTEEQTLVHVDDSGDATEVKGDVSATGANFEADSFSTYYVVGTGGYITYENQTYEHSIQPSEQLTLTSPVKTPAGKYMGGTWAVTAGEDIISFTKGSDTEPKESEEAPSVGIKTSGKAGDATVTFTYKITTSKGEDEYTDTYNIHVKGYVFHFNANGASGTVEDISATIGVSGSANITLPDQGSMERSGYNFKGWSMTSDHMTDGQRHGWYAYDKNTSDPTKKIYKPGATFNITTQSESEEYTFYAMWAQNTGASGKQIGFFVRDDGTIQSEPASYSSSFYTTVTPGGAYYKSVSDLTEYITEIYTEIDVDEIDRKVTQKANDEVEAFIRDMYQKIQKNGSNADKKKYAKFDMDKYYIQWYVIKDQGSWHVDGTLRARPDAGTNDDDTMVSLDFRKNADDVTGECPVGRQWTLKQAKAGVTLSDPAQNTLARVGYTFNGWDTQKDGSGQRYSDGETIKFEKNTILYAQWLPNDGVPYTLYCHDSETKEEIKDTRKTRTGVTGNHIEAKIGEAYLNDPERDDILEGYVFDADNPNNVTEAKIKGDGTTELHLWFKPAHAVAITAQNGSKIYDGEEVSPIASFTVDGTEITDYTVNDGTITFTFNGNDYTIENIATTITKDDKSASTIKDAGSYAISFGDGEPVVNKEGTSFTISVTPGEYLITKRPVTVTSDSGEWKYDGQAHTAENVTVTYGSPESPLEGDPFVGDDELPSVTYTGSQKTIGTSKNTFTCNTENLTNYEFTLREGDLTVTASGDGDPKYEINVQAKGGTIVYDGEKHEVNKDDFEILGSDSASSTDSLLAKLGDFVSGTSTTDFSIGEEDFTITGLAASGDDATDVGKYKRIVTETSKLTIKDSSGTNVTGEFIVNKIDGELEITKRPVTLKSASLTKPYDGTALKNPDDNLITSEKDTIKITENGSISEGENVGFVSGEGVEKYEFSGKQKKVGTGSGENGNVFSYQLNSKTKEANYDIKKVYGDLVVTNPDAKIDVTVTPKGEPDDGTGGNPDGENEDGTDDDSDEGSDGETGAESDSTPNGAMFKYDGSVQEVKGFVDELDEEGRLIVTGSNGQTYYVDGLDAGASGTDAGSYKVVVSETEKAKVYDDEGNDVTDQINIKIADAWLVITARNVTLTSASLAKPYDGKPLTNPQGQLIVPDPNTENGDTYTITTNGSVGGDGFVGDDNATYNFGGSRTIKGGTGLKENAFTYTLNANEKNYNVKTVFGDLVVGTRGTGENDKLGATITANSGTIDAYDGQPHTIEGFVGQEEDGSIKVTVNDVEYTISGVTATATGTDAGDYTTTIDDENLVVTDAQGNDVTDEFKVTIVPGTLTINKATVNIKSASLTKAYDGRPLGNGDTLIVPEPNAENGDIYEITEQGIEEGWAEGEGAVYTFTGSQRAVGSSENTIAIASYNGDAEKYENNYNINISSGTLTVTNRNGDLPTITITPKSDEVVYDGQPHTVNGFEDQEVEEGVMPTSDDRIPVTVDGETYYVTGYTSEATGTDANGDGINTTVIGTPVVTDEDGNNVTEQFNVVTKTGTLKITKRPLTIKSATLTKVYDGKALKNGDTLIVPEPNAENGDTYVITEQGVEEGWVEGEGATYTFTGKQKVVGDSSNAFTIAANEGTNLDNYELPTQEDREGRLIVTSNVGEDGNGAFEITITANSGEFTYDGESHTVNGLVGQNEDGSITITRNGETYTVTGLSAEKTGTHVADSGDIEVSGTAVVTDDEGNNVTAQFSVNKVSGKLTINKRAITVRSADGSWEYDGKKHTGEELDPKFVVTATASADAKTEDAEQEEGESVSSNTGWVEGDEPVWKFTGSQKAVGTSSNTFEEIGNKLEAYAEENGDYDVTLEYGTLEVTGSNTQYEINVRANDIPATYDGQKHSAEKNGFTLEGATSASETSSLLARLGDFATGTSTTDFSIGDETFTITGLSAGGEGTDAGEYTLSVTGNETIKDSDGNDVTEQFTVNKIDGTLTIEKKTVKIQSATLTKTYDGEPLTNGDTPLAVEDGWVDSVRVENCEFTGSQEAVGRSANAFTYTLNDGTTEEQYNENGHKNYIIEKSEGELIVESGDAQYEVTVMPNGYSTADPNGGIFLYDGTEKSVSGFVGEKDNRIEVTASNGKTYYVSGLTAGAALTDAGETKVSVSGDVKVEDAKGNDVTTEFRVKCGEATLKVTKRSVILTAASLSKPYDGDSLANPEGQLTGLTSADPVTVVSDGKIEGDGFAEGEGATYTFSGSQTLVGSAANVLSYTLNGDTKPENYIIKTNNGTLTVENRNAKYEATIVGNSGSVESYDGKEHTVTGFVGQQDDGSVPYTIGNKTYYISGLTHEVKGTDAATGENSYTGTTVGTLVVKDADGNVVTDQFNVTVTPGTLSIGKKTVTLRSADLSKAYDGTALVNGDNPIAGTDGFIEKDRGEVSYNFTGSQTIVGYSANAFTYTLKDEVAKNYTINKSEGTLTVENRGDNDKFIVAIQANSKTEEYNGKTQSVSGFENETADGVPVTVNGITYYVSGITSTASAKDVNVDENGEGGISTTLVGTAVVKDSAGNDVTNQFKVTPVAGTLKITKRPLKLTSADLSKPYDGDALVNGDTPLAEEEGWAEGEGATYTFTGSQKKPGSSANSFGINPNQGTSLDNYALSKTEGTLTVANANAKFEVTVTGKSDAVKYDGQPHTVSGFEGQEKDSDPIPVQPEGNANTYYVSGLTSTVTATTYREGGYGTKITGNWTVTDGDGEDVTDQFNVNTKPGNLTIDKRQITLTSEDKTKVYDGNPLTGEGGVVEIGGDGLAKGETLDVVFTGSQTWIGSSPNSFTYNIVKGGIGGQTTNASEDEGTGLLERLFAPKFIVHAEELLEDSNAADRTADSKATGGNESNYEIEVITGTLSVTAKGEGEDGPKKVDPSKVVQKTHDDGVYKIGKEVTFTVTATNIYADARTITFIEQEGVTLDQEVFEAVPAGESVSTTARYTVTEADVTSGNGFTNTVTASIGNGSGGDSEPGDDFEAKDEVVLEEANSALKVVKKSDTTGAVRVGQTIGYTIDVINNGNTTISNISVTDELTGDSFTIDSLRPHVSKQFESSYTVAESDVAKGKVVNVAVATGKDPNGNDVTSNGGGSDDVDGTEGRTDTAVNDVDQSFILTIHYVDEDGNPMAADYQRSYQYGQSFYVESPKVDGYTPSYTFVASDANGMPGKDVDVTVTYTKNPAADTDNGGTTTNVTNVTNNTTENNDNSIFNIFNRRSSDDDSSSSSSSKKKSSSSKNGDNNAANQAEGDGNADENANPDNTPASAPSNTNGNSRTNGSGRTRNGADGGGVITITEDGEPQLVSASDAETPLFNLGLGDHKCNVLRLLILLAAFAVVLVHTKKMKEYQSRLFELREKLEEEKK